MSDEQYHMKVSRIPWNPENYILDGSDYVFGMLLEIPEMYYVVPNRTVAYIYILGRGLVKLHHDFSHLNEVQTDHFIRLVRRDFEQK
jgi:hypothetical protein